jgi:pyrimidine-nucleoside phosphorylase
MLVLGGISLDLERARNIAENSIQTGSAFQKFKSLVAAQGGDESFVDDPSKFPKAQFIESIKALKKGYISQVHARMIGEASVILGAGRAKKGDSIDHSVGIVIHRKIGDYVESGDPIYTLYANNQGKAEETKRYLFDAIIIQDEKISPLPLFYE